MLLLQRSASIVVVAFVGGATTAIVFLLRRIMQSKAIIAIKQITTAQPTPIPNPKSLDGCIVGDTAPTVLSSRVVIAMGVVTLVVFFSIVDVTNGDGELVTRSVVFMYAAGIVTANVSVVDLAVVVAVDGAFVGRFIVTVTVAVVDIVAVDFPVVCVVGVGRGVSLVVVVVVGRVVVVVGRGVGMLVVVVNRVVERVVVIWIRMQTPSTSQPWPLGQLHCCQHVSPKKPTAQCAFTTPCLAAV